MNTYLGEYFSNTQFPSGMAYRHIVINFNRCRVIWAVGHAYGSVVMVLFQNDLTVLIYPSNSTACSSDAVVSPFTLPNLSTTF